MIRATIANATTNKPAGNCDGIGGGDFCFIDISGIMAMSGVIAMSGCVGAVATSVLAVTFGTEPDGGTVAYCPITES